VFRRLPNQASWQEDAILTASNGSPGDLFGYSVAIDVTSTTVWVAVGAPQHANLAGAAYVYYRNASGVWTQIEVVHQPSPQSGDLFGAAVAYRVSGLAISDHLLAMARPIAIRRAIRPWDTVAERSASFGKALFPASSRMTAMPASIPFYALPLPRCVKAASRP